jgi:hypothetical protein
MLKAVYNKEKKTKNLVTTITGLISLLVSGLCLFGILTAEQGAGLTEYATMAVTSIFKAEDAGNIVLPKAGKKAMLLLMFIGLSFAVNAQDTGKFKGFFRPVEPSDIATAGLKSDNSAWKFRPTASLVATSYVLNYDEFGEFRGFDSKPLSGAGLGLSYAHYILSEGEPYNNYSVNALLLLSTDDKADVSLAGTLSAFQFVNVGVGYKMVSGNFKQNLFFLTGVSVVF